MLLSKLTNVNTNGDVNKIPQQDESSTYHKDNNANEKSNYGRLKCVGDTSFSTHDMLTLPVDIHDNGVIAISTFAYDAHSQDCICGGCEVNKATAHCRQCGFALCAECIERTHTKGRFKEHELCKISGSDMANQITAAPCKRHCV